MNCRAISVSKIDSRPLTARSQAWENFVHETDELVIVLEGKMEFEVSGKVVHPEPGAEIHIPAGANHSARNIGQTTSRWLYGYRQA